MINFNKYYFAYGKNMDFSELINRWKKPYENWKGNSNSSIIEKITNTREHGIIHNYELIFNKKSKDDKFGYANIKPSNNKVVEGVLYHFETDEFIECLDNYEGFPNHYKKEHISIQRNDKTYVNALVYIANHMKTDDGLKPKKNYIDHLLMAKDILSQNYIEKLESIDCCEILLSPIRGSHTTLKSGKRESEQPDIQHLCVS